MLKSAMFLYHLSVNAVHSRNSEGNLVVKLEDNLVKLEDNQSNTTEMEDSPAASTAAAGSSRHRLVRADTLHHTRWMLVDNRQRWSIRPAVHCSWWAYHTCMTAVGLEVSPDCRDQSMRKGWELPDPLLAEASSVIQGTRLGSDQPCRRKNRTHRMTT